MKKMALMAVFCLLSVCCFAQSMGIRFYDKQGREFVVYAPYGQFSYSMFEGDYLSRDYEGRVTRVGDTFISYDYEGRVNRIADIYISYDYDGRVTRVGGLYIHYDYNGNITRTSGSVR